MSLDIGSRIGDYEIVSVLGAGGMGKVFKVRNVISDRVEAMKVLLPDLEHEPELADRFMREIKVQASLQHPNIASLHTALRVENQLLMIMELVEGMTIEQRLHRGPIPLDQGIACIGQVLAALAYAHESGVIHRDIKPANMMLTTSGTVKLMDFGIAKAAADRKLTMTGTTMGSLYYMSPEQIQGMSNIDARSDLYSVGVSLYEVVTGKKPFDGDSQFAIMAAHLEKSPVPPITLDSRLPAMLNDVILMSIAKDPAQRFQSAKAFGNALSTVGQSLGMPAMAPTPAPAAPVYDATAMTAPMTTPQPFVPQAAPPLTDDAQPKSGMRWLWVSAGALAMGLALVAAIQFGPWHRTSAQSPQPETTTAIPVNPSAVQPPATEPPVTEPQQTNPPASGSPVTATPSQTAASGQTAQPVSKPRTGGGVNLPRQQPARQTLAAQPTGATSAPQTSAPQTSTPAATPQTPPVTQPSTSSQPATQARPPQAVADAAAALQELREQAVQLASRVGAVHNSLANLKRSQAASGMSLRGDMASAESRMDYMMDGLRSALNAHDTPAAKKFLDSADREVEKLEKFLGL